MGTGFTADHPDTGRLASLVLGMGLPVTASYIVLATLSAPLIFDLISQSQLLSALQSGDPLYVTATIGLFGGDPAVALQEMPMEMKQLIRQESRLQNYSLACSSAPI